MVLAKQLADVQLQGLDTKTDAKLVVPGKLLGLENARFEKTGRISKRLGNSIVASTTDNLRRIYGLNNSLYAIKSAGSTGETFERRGHSLGTLSLGNLALPKLEAEIAVGGFPAQYLYESRWTVDSAYLDANTVVYATLETNGVRVTWYDSTNGSVAFTFLGAAIAGRRLRIMVVGGFVLVAVLNVAANAILVYDFTTSAATLRATVPNVYATFANLGWDWAATADGAAVYFSHVETTSSATLIVRKLTVGGWVLTSSATWAAAGAVTAVGLGAYTTIRVFWSDATNGLSTRTYSTALANTLASTQVVAATDARRAIAVDVDSTEVAHVVWSVTLASAGVRDHHSMRFAQVTTLGVPGTIGVARGAGLASKIYRYTQDGVNRIFVLGLLGQSSAAIEILDEQSGCVVFEFKNGSTTATMRGRALFQKAGLAPVSSTGWSANERGVLVNMHAIGSTGLVFGCSAVSVDLSLELVSAVSVAQPSARLLRCTLSPSSTGSNTAGYFAAEQDDCLLITGGVLHMFDGRTLRENGFLAYPTISTLAQAAAGSIADGAYSIIIVYERVDARGRVVRSAASNPFAITIAAGGGTASINITVTSYRIGLANNGTDKIVVYRAASGSTSYRRELAAANDPTVDTQTINVTTSAAQLALGAQLYTNGGELDHEQPSAPVCIAVDKDRAYVVCGDDPFRVALSKPLGTGEGPAFLPDTTRAVSSSEGPITALARMDGKLFAYKRRQVLYANGDGPDELGQNDTMGDFMLLHEDTGAVDQRSVLSTENGIIAFGQKGFWLIGNNMQRSYVGADVEDYNLFALFDATYVPDRNEARFLVYSAASTTVTELVYNDQFGAWSTNPDFRATALATIAGQRHFIHSVSGATTGVYREVYPTELVGGSFFDAHKSAYCTLKIVTGWLKFAGLQGYMRTYEFYLLGENMSTHTLQVRLRYDYETAYTETRVITSANATVGSSAYQFRVQLAHPKCEAVAIEISDQSAGGESFSLAGLTALVGIKGGPFKLRTGKATA